MSKSGYYEWKNRVPSKQSRRREELLNEIKAVDKSARHVYGARRIKEVLVTKFGRNITRRTVIKLMKIGGIVVKRKRRGKPKAASSNQELKFAPNLLDRKFDTLNPNEVWVSDIKYIDTDEGWLFLATVMDLFARRIVGWSMADSMEAFVAVRAFNMACDRRGTAPLLFHSDRGSQYSGKDFEKALQNHPDCHQSMSRKGNCHDNAVAESFFSTLERELLCDKTFASHEEASVQIFEYIEGFYNTVRLHSHLNYVSPVEFELAMQPSSSG